MIPAPAHGEVSNHLECGECGGSLQFVDHAATDASATQSYECVDCGATGDVLISKSPDSPTLYGCVTKAENGGNHDE